ncbi:MAG: hypothetical protein R2769_14530 [Saprospiraceae bacterium]
MILIFDIMYDFYLSFLNAPAIESDGLINGMSFELIGTMFVTAQRCSGSRDRCMAYNYGGKGEKKIRWSKLKQKPSFQM